MANCTVSGTFTNSQGTAISGATVRFNIESPVLDPSGNLLAPKEVSTTTATDGTWSLSLIQGIVGNLTLDLAQSANSPTVRYNFSMVIPSTTTATFASCWSDSVNFGGQSSSSPLTFASISGTLATAQLPALPATEVWVGNSLGAAAPVALSGDMSLTNSGVASVTAVGGSTAANVHAAELLANAATNANTASTIVKRDGSGNFSAGTISAALSGNATTATTAGSFSGSLAGDVTGTQALTRVVALQGVNVASTTPTDAQLQVYSSTGTKYNPVSLSGDVTVTNAGTTSVASVGGSTASAVHTAELLANAATNANTASTIVKRDGSGNFTAGTITAALTGNASTVTTNANLTGVITSVGNATSIASQTGSGSKFVVDNGPTLIAPVLGAATGTSLSVSGQLTSTVATGTAPLVVSSTTQVANLKAATAGNADTVTTNANLTGDVTSVGNATTLTNAPVIAKVLTGYSSGAGTVAATDTILQAIQKLNGNDATNANLTGDVTSVGNATTLTNAPVIAKVLTGYTSGAGTVAATDTILQAIQKLNGNDATNANLTGNVTSVGNATTIASNVVTNAMLSTVATATFKGRTTAATGNVEDLTATQATALLNAMVGDSGSGGTKGLVPAPVDGDAAAGKFLKASGAWALAGSARAEVRVNSWTGYGSTDTKVIKWVNNPLTTGTNINATYNDATHGGFFTINAAGIYTVSFTTKNNATGGAFCITVNCTQLTTAPASISDGTVRASVVDSGGNTCVFCSWTGILAVNDVIRFHSDGTAATASIPYQTATICQVSS